MDLATILVGIANTVAGAVLGFILPALVDQFRYLRKSGLLGGWKSAQYRHDRGAGAWVYEQVVLQVRFGRIRIIGPKAGYDARGKILHRTLIFGEWSSTRSGAHATGHFELTLHPDGQILYGEMQIPTDNGGHHYTAWVLGRTEADIAKAKQLLLTTRAYFSEFTKAAPQ